MVYAHISHGLLDSPAEDGPVAVGRPAPGAARVLRVPGRQEAWGISGVGLSWRTRWRMKPRASQPQNHSPCPCASARSVLTGRRPGPRSGSLSYATCQGRAAEDVGPYHPSCPDAAWRAKDSRRPRRGVSERARRAKDSRRLGAGRPNESCA